MTGDDLFERRRPGFLQNAPLKGMPLGEMVNTLLRQEIQMIQTVR
jgi:hypothetical protein